jgi:pseudomonalisin
VLHIGVALVRPSAAAEDAYAKAVADRSSSSYHHFLTPSAFAARFGVPAATTQAVASWLTAGGLKIAQTSAAGDWIQATGTVAQVDRLMGVTIAAYQSKGTSFLANEAPPSVPAGLPIATIVGLNTLQRFTTGNLLPSNVLAPLLPGVGCLPSCDYTPQDLWSLYNQPSSDEGQGQTMAVFGDGRTDDVISDLRQFEASMGLPAVPITVVNPGAGPFTDDSGLIEWDLDTQSSTGMSPQAAGETLYFPASLGDADVETALTAWVNDPNGPLQANASFGECETTPLQPVFNALPSAVTQFVVDGDNLEPVAEATLEQATIEGRTLFAAAGDTGSSCPLLALPVVGAGNGVLNQIQPLQNYPCASDFAVCVGGTVLYSDGGTPPQRSLEYAWPFTGGGSSGFIAEPSFQQGVAAIDHPCLLDSSGGLYPPGTICRGAPDVAAMSGDIATNGYDIVNDGSPTVEGGTSLSSPLWMGMWTRVQAAAPLSNGVATGLGFADPVFYDIGTGKTGNYSSDFYDITTGSNGLYLAEPGWDYVSGWGTPNVTNLTQDLDGTLTPTGGGSTGG